MTSAVALGGALSTAGAAARCRRGAPVSAARRMSGATSVADFRGKRGAARRAGKAMTSRAEAISDPPVEAGEKDAKQEEVCVLRRIRDRKYRTRRVEGVGGKTREACGKAGEEKQAHPHPQHPPSFVSLSANQEALSHTTRTQPETAGHFQGHLGLSSGRYFSSCFRSRSFPLAPSRPYRAT